MATTRSMEEQKKEHFRETMDRLTAASHMQVDYFGEHKRIEGYYEGISDDRFFKCDRLMKQENMFGKIQLGYNPNRKRVFLFANLKTSRYDTVASQYQKEMNEYRRRTLLKGDNENRAFVSNRRENAVVLIEKKENKPWTVRSVKTYLNRTNTEAAKKTLPFFSREEEWEELKEVKSQQKEIEEDIRELRLSLSKEEEASSDRIRTEQQIQTQRRYYVENLAKENLLEALLIRKNTAEKSFLRKINYAYDFQKKDIESYYREKQKEQERKLVDTEAEDDGTEDEQP